MVMLCFVLDLRSFSHPVLRDLKQSLLQLANYYAISFPKSNRTSESTRPRPLFDKIGICYFFRDRISCCDEMKIAYNPQGNKFNLRDFHHAVNSLPNNAFYPEFNDFGSLYLKLADLLCEKLPYAWEVHDKNISRKVIVISASVFDTLDSMMLKTLTDVVDRRILVEFVFLEQASSHLGDITVKINHFAEQIDSLTNNSFRTYAPDLHVLNALAKRWFLELTDCQEESMEARFIFKIHLSNNINQIDCDLHPSYYPIVDEFAACQTCRCHGIPLDIRKLNQSKRPLSCPVTKCDLEDFDIVDNSVSIGEQTVLYMPSFKSCQKQQHVSSTIDFSIIQRTNLGSLSEGHIMGSTYYVTPASHNSDKNDKSELNNRMFQMVCSALHALDWGLVCSSNCNIETFMETSLRCYYILLPSDKGLMLLRLLKEQKTLLLRSYEIVTQFGLVYYAILFEQLREFTISRLLSAEEFLPAPHMSKFINPLLAKEVERSELEYTVQILQKIELSDYNPVQRERGFHQKLNLLVKESLQFGAILPKCKEGVSVSDWSAESSPLEVSPPEQTVDVNLTLEEVSQVDLGVGEDKAKPGQAEEWEQLIVTEFGSLHTPTLTSRPKLDQLVTSGSQSNKQVDEKTSRILERLEGPRQLKRKAVFPTISGNLAADLCPWVKKPLIPYEPNHAVKQGLSLSQPLRPNFQRIKRKK